MNLKDTVLILIASAIAALLNLLPVYFFSNFNILLGPFIALMITVLRGPISGLLVSIISMIPVVIHWNFIWALPVFALEIVFVCICHNRLWKNLLVTVFIFWLIIGMPLWWFLIKQSQIVIDSHIMFSTLSRLMNSIIYAHLAVIFTKYDWLISLINPVKTSGELSLKKKYAQQLSVVFVSFGMVIVIYNLYTTAVSINSNQYSDQNLQHSKIKGELNTLIKSRMSSMAELSFAFSEEWSGSDVREQKLISSFKRLDGYISMILADENANVINFIHKDKDVEIEHDTNINIADRAYFTNAIYSDKPYVSSGFQGRGLGKDLIAVISCSIPGPDEKNNLGIIQGAMVLGQFSELKQLFNRSEEYTGVLLDQNNKALFYSDNLHIKELDEIQLKNINISPRNQEQAQLRINSQLTDHAVYTYHISDFDWGWKLVSLHNDSITLSKFEKLLIYSSLALLFLAFLAEIAAHALSSFWTKQLTQITNTIQNINKDTQTELEIISDNTTLPQELELLNQTIISSHKQVKKVNDNLKKIVRKKTKQLKKSNQKLKFLANHDHLTGLYNRRYFDSQLQNKWDEFRKKNKRLSVYMIDIDFFKKVNDNWGHPAGDSIIKEVGNYLAGINDSNLLYPTRLGGEEFIIVSTYQDFNKNQQMVTQIQAELSDNDYQIDNDGSTEIIKITVSIGWATIESSEDQYNQLYRLADKALYKAKNSGRNCVKFFQEISQE